MELRPNGQQRRSSRAPYALFGYDLYIGHEYEIPADVSMYGKFRLDIMYPIHSPGTYSVKASKAAAKIGDNVPPLTSNTLTVTVLPLMPRVNAPAVTDYW